MWRAFRPHAVAAILAGSLLLGLTPVGAQEDQQAETLYEVIIEEGVMVPMSDGAMLAIDIYRPDAEGAFPALVERTPYNRSNSSEIQAFAHLYFAERGYAFLVQDTRGRYDFPKAISTPSSMTPGSPGGTVTTRSNGSPIRNGRTDASE